MYPHLIIKCQVVRTNRFGKKMLFNNVNDKLIEKYSIKMFFRLFIKILARQTTQSVSLAHVITTFFQVDIVCSHRFQKLVTISSFDEVVREINFHCSFFSPRLSKCFLTNFFFVLVNIWISTYFSLSTDWIQVVIGLDDLFAVYSRFVQFLSSYFIYFKKSIGFTRIITTIIFYGLFKIWVHCLPSCGLVFNSNQCTSCVKMFWIVPTIRSKSNVKLINCVWFWHWLSSFSVTCGIICFSLWKKIQVNIDFIESEHWIYINEANNTNQSV